MLKKNFVLTIICVFAIGVLILKFCFSNTLWETKNLRFNSDEITSINSNDISDLHENDLDWTDSNALNKVQRELIEIAGCNGKILMVHEDIHFYDNGRIMLEIQNCSNPDYLDAYTYENGKWSAPAPVRTSIHDPWKEKLFPLNNIHFSAVSKIVSNYNAKASQVEGSTKITHIYLVDIGKLTWYPRSIDGTRESYSIEFNLNGDVKSFERN